MIFCRLLTAPPDPAVVDAIASLEAALLETPWGAQSLAETIAQPGTLLAVAEDERCAGRIHFSAFSLPSSSAAG